MKDSTFHVILIRLYNEDVYSQKQVDITDFLKSVRDIDDDKPSNFNRISYAIDKIQALQYANFNYIPSDYHLTKLKNGIISTLENTTVNAVLETKGFEYIRNYIMEKEQHESVLFLNKETKIYYEKQEDINKSIVDFNETLKITNIIAIIIAGITGFFIAFSAVKDDSAQLQLLNKQLKQTVLILDSMQKTQIRIDSSLKTMAKNSSKKK